jgi:hypothetical protein
VLKTEANYMQTKNQRRSKTGKDTLELQNSVMLKDLRLRDRLNLVWTHLVRLGMICDMKARIKGAKGR